MFNMTTMAAQECRTNAGERGYHTWLNKLGTIQGRPVEPGSKAESEAFDLFADGCSPEEAAEELEARVRQ